MCLFLHKVTTGCSQNSEHILHVNSSTLSERTWCNGNPLPPIIMSDNLYWFWSWWFAYATITSPSEEKTTFFSLKKQFSLSSLFSLFARKTPAQLFTQRHDARYALSLSLVCLFIYAKRLIICEEYYFVSARLIKRFCVAAFASGGFFLFHHRFCARFSSFSC